MNHIRLSARAAGTHLGGPTACTSRLRPPAHPPAHGNPPRRHVAAAREEVGVLGGEDFILSQKSGVEEALFKGNLLGVDADVASGAFSESEFRALDHIGDPRDYHVPPQFLDQFALHLSKNYLHAATGGRHPLILGIWGHKGCGKSFNLALCCKLAGVTPIIVGSGELEDEEAGRPGHRLRERYRQAAEAVQKQGRPTCLIIDDLDAGVGRFGDTQMTVNNQMVQATLMAICDDPEHVSVGQDWREGDCLPRVPIFVTGNDLSRLYAPLLRDGRMAKWYWAPSRGDVAAMVARLFGECAAERDVAALVDAFPGQPLDFFAAVRSRLADAAVRDWVARTGLGRMGEALVPDGPWYDRERVSIGEVPASLQAMMAAGRDLAREQQRVNDVTLSVDYLPEEVEAPPPPPPPTPPTDPQALRRAAEEAAAREAAAAAARAEALQALREQDQGEFVTIGTGPEEEDVEEKDWPCVDVVAARAMVDEGYAYVDVRAEREFDKEKFKRAVSLPAVDVTGTSLQPVVTPRSGDDILAAFRARFPDRGAGLLVVGGAGADGGAVVGQLRAAGYSDAVEVMGGFEAWAPFFRTDGTRRCFGKWGDPTMPAELEMWTASN